ncbi:MAG: Uma2 family endonuclease [Deltaproteobacteria bacterium]|nr:Uma2 family endonuclease [Deltaproteobacteria bacterium]
MGVDPDVCLVDPTPPDAKLRSLRTWEPGHAAPRVAVEVVSRDTAEKDYFEGPAKYAASGTRELWVFDPERRGRGALGPSVLQVWRRMDDGAFRRVFAGDAPAYSNELGAWLRVTDYGTLAAPRRRRSGRASLADRRRGRAGPGAGRSREGAGRAGASAGRAGEGAGRAGEGAGRAGEGAGRAREGRRARRAHRRPGGAAQRQRRAPTRTVLRALTCTDRPVSPHAQPPRAPPRPAPRQGVNFRVA